jgi:hypothetical protein
MAAIKEVVLTAPVEAGTARRNSDTYSPEDSSMGNVIE